MGKKNNNKVINNKNWIVASFAGTIVIVINYVVIASTSTSFDNGNAKASILHGLNTLFGLAICTLISVACFKIKGLTKIAAIICLLIGGLFTFLSYFAYSFLQYPY